MEKKHIYFIICGIIITGLICSTVKSSIESYRLGRLSDQYREQLDDAADINRRLAETITECQSICGNLSGTCESNIRSVREAIDCLEQIREEVYSLEMELGCFDWDKYYDYWDNYLELQ